MKVGIDLDGTLLNYGNHTTELSVNRDLIARLKADGVTEVAVITNQGGLCFHESNPTKYPSPERFFRRLTVGMDCLFLQDIAVDSVRVALYHPKGDKIAMSKAGSAIIMAGLNSFYNFSLITSQQENDRKPGTGMFVGASITRYYGDSDEDEQAALAAGVEFVRVDRFMGAK